MKKSLNKKRKKKKSLEKKSKKKNAQRGARTHDPQIKSLMLYRSELAGHLQSAALKLLK